MATIRRQRTAPSAPPVTPAPLPTTRAVRRVAKNIDLAELRKKVSAATGGAVPETFVHSNEAVVERYKSRIKNRGSAIRAKCIDCSAGMPSEVAECKVCDCPLHLFRMGNDPFRHARANDEPAPVPVMPRNGDPIVMKYVERIHNRGTAVRAKCMHCTNGQREEIRHCPVTTCPLWAFRMGKNPLHARSTVEGDPEIVEESDDDDVDAEGEEA